MFIFTLTLISLLCLSLSETRPYGAIGIVLLCYLSPEVLIGVLVLGGLGILMYNQPNKGA